MERWPNPVVFGRRGGSATSVREAHPVAKLACGVRRLALRNVKGSGAFGRLSAKGATRLQSNGTSVKAKG